MAPRNKRPFPFVHSIIDRHGHRRHYFRRSGYRRVTLPGAWGSAEFQDAYRKALAGETAPKIEIGAGRRKPGSVAALVALYFRETYGERSFAALERRHVEPMVAAKAATPYAARNFLKALRAVVAIARRAGVRDDDPTEGIRVKVRATAGFRTWTEDDIAQFEAAYPIGTRARLAFGLLLFTGQRRGDVIHMGRQHVKGNCLTVRQGKTGATVVMPLHPKLQALLADSGASNLTFLTTATGKPFAPGAFTNWFGTLCRAAGSPLGLSAHGLRKAMCRRLAEAGCSANQIAAISGHASLREVARYTKAADQTRMARDAIEAITGTTERKPPRPKLGDYA